MRHFPCLAVTSSQAQPLHDEILPSGETGQMLVRGRKEIALRLLSVRDRGGWFSRVSSFEGRQRRFRLLHAEVASNLLVFTRELPDTADLTDTDDSYVTLSCACMPGRAEFVISAIAPFDAPDRLALRTAFPDVLLVYQNRCLERIPVPPDENALLEWEFRTGHVTFRARILDIGPGGAGALLLEPGLSLDAGARLTARIVREGHPPVAVDLEVRCSTTVLLENKCRAVRTGFQFLTPPCELESLLTSLQRAE